MLLQGEYGPVWRVLAELLRGHRGPPHDYAVYDMSPRPPTKWPGGGPYPPTPPFLKGRGSTPSPQFLPPSTSVTTSRVFSHPPAPLSLLVGGGAGEPGPASLTGSLPRSLS